jgi:asparagine synthase (glutamine-hydrolysing)
MSALSVIIYHNIENINTSDIAKLNNIAAHRGSAKESYHVAGRIAFGFRQNEISSEPKNQPLEIKGKILMFDGDFIDFEDDYLKNNHITISTAEKIIYLYEKYGTDLCKYLSGKFAIIILDDDKLLIARDHFGIKPLYYFKNQNYVLITSEIKQIAGFLPEKSKLNRHRVFDFLSKGILDRTDETLFDQIRQVKAGHYSILNIHNPQITQIPYYVVSDNISIDSKADFNIAKQRIREMLFLNTTKMLKDVDKNVSTAVSGGLDSSIVTSILSKIKKTSPIEALAVCIGVGKFDETKHAETVSKHLNIKLHKVVPTFEDFKKHLNDFIYCLDEPVGTDSAFASYLFYQKAKELNFKIVFGGVGADAYLAGYEVYYKIYFKDLFKKRRYLTLAKEFYNYFKVNGFQHFNYLKMKKNQDNDFTFWLNKSFCESNNDYKISPANNVLEYSINHISTNTQIIFHCEDRFASLVGIEPKFPFCEKRLIHYSLGLPDNFKIGKGWRKYILREAFKNDLPLSISYRKDNIGFYNPGREWMRENPEWFLNEMKETVEKWNSIINKDTLQHFENYLQTGESPYSDYVFWRILFFGRWTKIYNIED